MRFRVSVPVALLLLVPVGCRETVAGPGQDEPIDLRPRVVGAWTGTYVGRLALLGADEVARDTFQIDLTVFDVGVDFAYSGEVLWGGPGATHLYDCNPMPVMVTNDRRATFDCVQGTQLADTLVLRIDVQADPNFETLEGTVRDVLGVEGATYPIELTRADP